MINVYPLPIEITDIIGDFFPRVYGQIDKDRIMEYFPSTLVGLAEHYLLEDQITRDDVKLIPVHFKWMGLFYTLDEMERLFLSIQLCETVRRYRKEFMLILEEIEIHIQLTGVYPTLMMTDDHNHLCVRGV